MTGELIHYKHLIEQYLSFMDFKNFFFCKVWILHLDFYIQYTDVTF